LFIDRPKIFGLGGNVLHARDVTRQVRWPLYVLRQRRRRVLERRMKVPPAVHQFQNTLDKATKKDLLTLLKKYSPEAAAKKAATQEAAKAGSTRAPARAKQLTFGIQEVTRAIETKRARLVVIAHDVDPVEIVLWLPQLCIAQGVPYAIVKSKSQLGAVVGHSTCTTIAVTDLNSEDQPVFQKLLTAINSKFTDRFEDIRRSWGGGQQGVRAQFRASQRKKAQIASGAKVE
jgi:large subunit ribosomal protein L7Ae